MSRPRISAASAAVEQDTVVTGSVRLPVFAKADPATTSSAFLQLPVGRAQTHDTCRTSTVGERSRKRLRHNSASISAMAGHNGDDGWDFGFDPRYTLQHGLDVQAESQCRLFEFLRLVECLADVAIGTERSRFWAACRRCRIR